MVRGKHAKVKGAAHAGKPERSALMRVGYPLAFAALLALAIGPGYAIATEAGSDAASRSAAGAPVASSKDETVHVYAAADGSVKNVEVTDKLTNAAKASELADSSSLANIENTEGDESYRGTGADMVWSANGNDIYYRGDSDQELPVSVDVTYKLDGRVVSADDLAGKSGQVEISYNFQNRTDAQGGVQVPFAAITGMLFDNDSFSGIEVDNGKVIDDGDRVVVIGYAMPGLAKSLGVGDDTIDIPSGFTVTARATDFELSSTLTMVTGNLFDSLDMDDLGTGELSDASSSLKDAMSQLIDGAGQLSDGLGSLADGAGQLSDGMSTMQDKVSGLPDGVESLYKGSDSLAKGLSAASDGASSLAEGTGSLEGGVSQLLSGEDGKGGLTAAQSGAQDLADGLSALPKMMDELNSGFSGIKGVAAQIKSKATDSAQSIGAAAADVQDAGTSIGEAGTALTALATAYPAVAASSDFANLKKALDSAGSSLVKAGSSLDTAAGDLANSDSGDYGVIALSVGISSGVDEAQAKIAAKSGDLNAAVTGSADLAKGLGEAVAGTKELSSGASRLSQGATALSEKLPSAASGAARLKDGLGKLNSSTDSLVAGVKQLVSGTAELARGSEEAHGGMVSLKDGLKQFDDEGITKITDFLDSDIVQASDNFEAVKRAGESYDNFSGITEGTAGSVKFVIETDAIE